MRPLRTKRKILALLVLILATSTLVGTYLTRINHKQDTHASPPKPKAMLSIPSLSFSSDIGETFQVNITITNASDVHVWQTGMSFNVTLLEAVSVEEGPLLQQGGQTLWIPGAIDNTVGIIHYSASALVGNATGVDGNGTLGIVTFRIKNHGNSTVQLTDVLVLNSRLNDIPKTTENGTITIKIPGDVNLDGIVNIIDAAAVSAHWYPGPPIGPLGYNPSFDINDDGSIDVLDAAIVNAYWTGPPRGPKAP